MARMTVKILASFAVIVALCLGAAVRADEAQDALKRVVELNKQALEDYDSGDHESAKLGLLEAIGVATKAGLGEHKLMARTYVNLAGVYVVGLQERARGTKFLSMAVKIQPGIVLTRPFDVPEMKQLLSEVRPAAPADRPPEPRPAPPEPKPAPAAKAIEDVPAPRKAPAPAPAEDEGPEEPDLPATIPQPLYCPNPDEAPPDEALVLRCLVQPGIKVTRVLLYYRLPGSEQFATVRTVKSPKGWYQGEIPAEATSGKSLQYYFEARDPSDQVAASAGRSDSPNLMIIRPGAPSVNAGSLAMVRLQRGRGEASEDRPDEDPLAGLVRSRREQSRAAQIHRRGPGALFVGLGVGSGYGWHPAQSLEFRDELEIGAGYLPAGAITAVPELGYQITQSFAISVLGRIQYIPAKGSGDPTSGMGSPATGAYAVLGRLLYFTGEGNAQLVFSAAFGGGAGFRLVVPPLPDRKLFRNDTVRGGPFVAGPGVGFLYHFSRHVAIGAEVRGLVGMPDFAAIVDGSGGLQFSF